MKGFTPVDGGMGRNVSRPVGRITQKVTLARDDDPGLTVHGETEPTQCIMEKQMLLSDKEEG